EIDLDESVSEGEELSITQSQENEDGETFESDPEKVTVQPGDEGSDYDSESDTDSGDEIDLDAPTVDDVTEGDQQVTGEGEPGSQVEITDSEGNVIGSGEVDDDGSFAVDLDESVSEGDELSIIQSKENEDGEKIISDEKVIKVLSEDAQVAEKDSDDGDVLPSTATDTFNWMLGGFLALIAGITGIFTRRKKEEK